MLRVIKKFTKPRWKRLYGNGSSAYLYVFGSNFGIDEELHLLARVSKNLSGTWIIQCFFNSDTPGTTDGKRYRTATEAKEAVEGYVKRVASLLL